MLSVYVVQSISFDLLIMERRNSRKGVLDMVGGAAMYLLLQAGRKKKRERVGLMGCMRK